MGLTFVIGDVHGSYHTLLALIEKLPKDANIIFVGDLIDRGKYSSDVIKYVRSNRYQSVLGNHEKTFIDFFKDYKSATSFEILKEKWETWLFYNGGKDYGLWESLEPNKEILDRVESDILWMQSLPIYIELQIMNKVNLPVVISHINITKVWRYKDDSTMQKHFIDRASRERDLRYTKESKNFNIYGHTPNTNSRANINSINVDTGCCFGNECYNRLSAYCIEDDTFIYIKKI